MIADRHRTATDFCIRNARVLLPDGDVVRTHVAVERGAIAGVGPTWAGTGIDAANLLLLPGIVDVHGDAFERQLMPRPGVHFPLDVALLDTDRQMVANGITTAFHGLTWSWEPGLRGRETALAFLDALERLKGVLACDTHVHLRHEIYNLDGVEQIMAWLAGGRIRLLAFNDHLPMLRRRVACPAKLAAHAERAQLSVEDFATLMEEVATRAAAVPPAIARLATTARRHGIVMASHDDDTPRVRRQYHRLGCSLCEFPTNRETAEAARTLGDAIVMGAPNVVRGGSHTGGMAAAEMVRDGLADVLTSDYYYPSLLHAAFRLVAAETCSLPAAWRLISSRPARLGGFDDRGEIAPGRRADLVLVDDRQPALPRVVATMVAGSVAYAARAWH